jgi:hypothetical protein
VVPTLSFTWNVKGSVPVLAKGKPEMTPVAAFRLNPGGSEPEATFHV